MTGLIVVDHGSKLESANQMLDQVVEMMAATPGYNFEPILAAHMDLASPTIAEAMANIYAVGVREVIVFPYFLSPGRHTTEDIPRLVKAASAMLPGMSAHIAEPFGINRKLIDAALVRIREVRDKIHPPPAAAANDDEPPTKKIHLHRNRTTRRMRPPGPR